MPASTTKSARGAARPRVLTLPGSSRNVNGSSTSLGVAMIQMVTAPASGRHQLAHPRVHDAALQRQLRLARDLVFLVQRERRLRRAVLAEQVHEESGDVLRVHLARV